MKKIKLLSVLILLVFTFSSVPFVGNSVEVNAATIPSTAEPVFKGGFVFGDAYTVADQKLPEWFSPGGATNKNGVTVIGAGSSGNMAGSGDFPPSPWIGVNSGFIVIINADGSLKKIQLASTNRHQSEVQAVMADSDGNFIVAGYDFSDTIANIGTIGLGSFQYPSQGKSHGYVQKIDQDGNLIWFNVVQGNDHQRVTSLAFDANGDIVAGGYTSSTTGVGTSYGKTDMFITKFRATDGQNIVAPKRFGGSGEDNPGGTFKNKSNLIVKDGFIYMGFRTNSPVNSGTITKKASKGTDYDFGFLKLDNDLNFVKYSSFGGNGDDMIFQPILTSTGSIFVPFETTNSTNLRPDVMVNKGGTDIKYVELDIDLNYINGGVIGGSADDKLIGYQTLPSGEVFISGSTKSTDGTFADCSSCSATDTVGFGAYLDTNTNTIKKVIYVGDSIARMINFSEGNYMVVGEVTDLATIGDGSIVGPIKGAMDLYTAKFGPTANTPAILSAKPHTMVLKDSGNVDVKKAVNASIGDYDGFISQDLITISPQTVSTSKSGQSFVVNISGGDATPIKSYIHVTENPIALVEDKQIIDAALDITVIAGTGVDSKKLLASAKASAWNIDTNEKIDLTVDESDLAAVNAVTTEVTVVPVKISIPNASGGLLTKTINVTVKAKATVLEEIKTAADEKWGPDQTEYAELIALGIVVRGGSVEEEILKIENSTKTIEEAKKEAQESLINVDTDRNGKADYNIDIDGDGTADINKDTNKDGTPDANLVQIENPKGLNYDKDSDGYPDTNIDVDGDGKADLNIDVDGDGKADLNIDVDEDGKADLNIDVDEDGKADLNIDVDEDGIADNYIDTDEDLIADLIVFSRDYQMNLSHFNKATILDHLNMSSSYVLDVKTNEKHYFDQVDVAKVPAQAGTYKVTLSFATSEAPVPAARSARVLPTVTARSLKSTVNLTIVNDLPVTPAVMPQTGMQNGIAYASIIVVMLAALNLTLRKKIFK